MIIKSAIIFAIVGVISGRNYYQDRIPNGHFVPNPCLTSQYWNTVGHLNPAHHTHLKNIFGHVSIIYNVFSKISSSLRVCFVLNRHEILPLPTINLEYVDI